MQTGSEAALLCVLLFFLIDKKLKQTLFSAAMSIYWPET